MPRACLCLFLCLTPFAVAGAVEMKASPTLVLDAGGHTAKVRQLLFTPDGKKLITVSDDKTVRFWDTATGESLRTLHPPAGPGPAGMLYAAAISPDGKTLAVGGYGLSAGRCWVYLIALPGGEVRRVLKGHSGAVNSLAFSPDGRRLASASADKTARIWDVENGTCDLTLEGHTDNVTGAAWSPNGKRVATASFDKTGRIWSAATGKAEAALRGHNGDVTCVDWSADGRTIATGGLDKSVRLWDTDGAPRNTVDKLGVEVLSVHFSPDSGRLLYTGIAQANRCAVVLALRGGGDPVVFKRHTNTANWGAFSPDGDLAATVDTDGTVFLWKAANGTIIHTLTGRGRFVRAVAWGDDPNGQALLWGNVNKGDSLNATCPLEHSFLLEESHIDKADGQPARRASLSAGSSRVTVAADQFSLTLQRGGDTVAEWKTRQKEERILCYTFLPNDRIAVGTNFKLYLLDGKTGKGLHTFEGHSGPIAALAPSADGRYLLSASGDETLRVWDPDKSAPVLSLFFAGNDWIAWTQGGYYAASRGGERLMGWQVENGAEKMASYYPASQFRKTLYRPDVIRRVLKAGSLERAIVEVDGNSGKPSRRTAVAQILPPKVAITSPTVSGLRLDKPRLNVEAVAVGAAGNPVASLRLLLDDRPYGGQEGLKKFKDPKPGEARASWDVDMPSGAHRLTVQAVGTASVGLSNEVEVAFTPAGQNPDRGDAPEGNLYVLAVGINEYPGKMKLDCAAPDAHLIAQTLQEENKGLFRKVDVKLLTDKDATRDRILQGLRWLRDNAKAGDVVVVFYAGHGDCKLADCFFLIPVDAKLKDLAGTGVSGDELKDGLADLPCSTVLMLDACYSGSIDAKHKRALPGAADGLVRDFAYSDGLVVLCGAAKEQEAAEESGHGYFTKALSEGLKGKAKDRQGQVTVMKLHSYVVERVDELSNGEQEPTISIRSTVQTISLAKP